MSVDMIIATALSVLIFGTITLTRVMLHESRELTIGNMLSSLVFGGIAWATMYFAPTVASASVAGIVLLCFVIAYLCYLGTKEASRWYELLLLFLVIALVVGAIVFAAKTIPDASPMTSIIPVIWALIAAAIISVSFFIYHRNGMHLADSETLSDSARSMYSVAAVIVVVLAIAAAVLIATQAFSKPIVASDGSEQTAAAKTDDKKTAKLKDYVDIVHYNSKLQNDGDKTNDYNFGPSGPIDSVDATKKEYWTRMKHDPGYAATQMWREDSKCNTTFLKKYYDACNGDVEEAINMAAAAFEKDPVLYEKYVTKFAKHVNKTNVNYEIGTLNVWQSQAYMDPHNTSSTGRPRVIAMKTASGPSHVFIQTRLIDGKYIKIVTRIECGYQPLDVEEDGFKITNPSGGDDNPNPPGPQPETEPETTQPSNPQYNKDPNKAPKKNTEPNDDKGPGPDTNNGKGARYSTKDQPDNSNHMTLPEYNNNLNKIKNINNTQQKSGDPNTPSTSKPSADTNVDNNGNNGTGNGGADTSTPTKNPAKQEDGTEINTKPAGQWDGDPG